MTNVLRRNNVSVSGAGGHTLLFAHGMGCDQTLWRLVAPVLEREHRVVLFDYVGCGGSDFSAFDEIRHATLDGYAAEAVEVIEALGGPRVTFVGHSVSAMIGVVAARKRPELFSRLVMVCPSSCYLNQDGYQGGFERRDVEGLLDLMEKNPLGWAGFLAPRVVQDPSRPDLEREFESRFCRVDPRAARRFAATTFYSDNRADLEHVRTPALVIQSEVDALAPPAVGRYVHERLPDSRFHLVPSIGHCPHLTHPDAVVAAIRDFIAGTPAAA